VDDYIKAGFNTRFVEFYWQPGQSTVEEGFAGWDKELVYAHDGGLYIVIYIHNTVHEHFGWKFDGRWREAVGKIVRRYKDLPNLIGWAWSDEYGDALSYPDEEFRKFLAKRYNYKIERLNASWGSSYKNFDNIRLEYTREKKGRPEKSTLQSDKPFGLGPRAFDSAEFKLFRARQACEIFEKTIREFDTEKPIFSGANNLGWPSTRVPLNWVFLYDFYPTYSGDDFLTHHVWMTDFGRSANLRPSMPVLMPETHMATPKWHLDARVLRGWVVESALHGACSIAIWPWGYLCRTLEGDRTPGPQRVEIIRRTFDQLSDSGLFGMAPKTSIAVLYQPWAEGWGNLSQMYGLLRKPQQEAFSLMQAFCLGTQYGQVDYLDNQALRAVDLDHYGVVFAPFAADMDEKLLDKLSKYVKRGGVLFADVGFGCLGIDKTVTSMPPKARMLFGIESLAVSEASPGAFRVTEACRDILGIRQPVAESTDKLNQMALDVTATSAIPLLRGPGKQGVFVNRYGEGLAIYSSALGWTSNPAEDALLSEIHNVLMGRRANIRLLGQQPANGRFVGTGEVFLYSNGYAVQNLTDKVKTFQIVLGRKDRKSHTVGPHCVLLVRDGREISLGTGVWPRE